MLQRAPFAAVAVITSDGATNEIILGSYFHLWLKQEGFLTGNNSADAKFVYFRASDTPLIADTAQALWTAMLPAAGPPNVNIVPRGSDPLFPIAGVVDTLGGWACLASPSILATRDPKKIHSALRSN